MSINSKLLKTFVAFAIAALVCVSMSCSGKKTKPKTAPTITSTAPITAAVGDLYTYSIITTGNPASAILVIGLPEWLSFDGEDTISGTPTAGDVGMTSAITITATNGIDPFAVQMFWIQVHVAPTITSSAPQEIDPEFYYSYTILSSGSPIPSLSVSGLPSWLTFDGINTISGTPATVDVGITGTITVTATNGIEPNAVQIFTIIVNPAPTAPQITSTAPASAFVGDLYSYDIASTGHPAPSLSVTDLPDWLTFDGVDTISGTPTLEDIGLSETILITAVNGIAPDAQQSFAITVEMPWIEVSGNVSVLGVLTNLDGGVLRLMDGMTVSASCVLVSGSYSLTVRPGTYTYNITLPNHFFNVIEPAGGMLVVGITDINQEIWAESTSIDYIKASNTNGNGIDNFGYSLSISGDTMVVGAYGESCNSTGINGIQSNNASINSGAAYVYVRNAGVWSQQAYLKASNTGAGDYFGYSVAISGDTIIVGAYREGSNATGVNGNQSNNSAGGSGAAYVFVRNAGVWSQEAYLKASNTGASDCFGYSVAISGETIVVGAYQEDSNATGIDGNQMDNSASCSGAAYVFVRTVGVWSQQAYLKASNSETYDYFGCSVSISDETIVVGSHFEDSNATGINGNQSDNSANASGAAYVFVRSAGVWSQQAYLKASNTEAGDFFGFSVAISGETIVSGAYGENSNAMGINGNQLNSSASVSGAAYVFVRNAGVWSQEAYLKASNTGASDSFGYSVSISGDTIVVGAYDEDSNATGVNGNQLNNSASNSGASYVFVRTAGIWSQQAYLKASNTETYDYFGYSVAICSETIVVGAYLEDSNATGVNGNQSDNSASKSGAAYVFVRIAGVWSQQAYVKASNTGGGSSDFFGKSVSISGDTMVIGAYGESSNSTGINESQSNNAAIFSGAAYVFVRNAGVWSQQAYLKASNTDASDLFGCSVSISGETIVVGAYNECSNSTGINGNQSNNSANYSGAAYVFVRNAGVWSQQAYLKASNTESYDSFGYSVSISGETIVVGARDEDSNAIGVNGNQLDNTALFSGAAYVFVRNAGVWSQEAYLKASNTQSGDNFGNSVAISGETIVVGAYNESSNATGVNGNQLDNSAPRSGAAYVFVRNAGSWSQQAYLKASNSGTDDNFSHSVAISGDTIVVGAYYEDSNATGINGNQSNNSADACGAAYVFVRTAGIWSQHAYLKASNAETGDFFGYSVAISGNTIIVGANREGSNTTGVNGNQSDDSASCSGAAYVFVRTASVWSQQAYLKASNTGAGDNFGASVSISNDTITIGANTEASNATGVNGDQSNNDESESGAAYVHSILYAPVFQNSAPTTAMVNTLYSYEIQYVGSPLPTVTVSGLPGWLNYDSGTRTISGTPTASDTGPTDEITVTATNGITPNAVQTFTITVEE